MFGTSFFYAVNAFEAKGVCGIPGLPVYPINPGTACLGSREELQEHFGGFRSPTCHTMTITIWGTSCGDQSPRGQDAVTPHTVRHSKSKMKKRYNKFSLNFKPTISIIQFPSTVGILKWPSFILSLNLEHRLSP